MFRFISVPAVVLSLAAQSAVAFDRANVTITNVKQIGKCVDFNANYNIALSGKFNDDYEGKDTFLIQLVAIDKTNYPTANIAKLGKSPGVTPMYTVIAGAKAPPAGGGASIYPSADDIEKWGNVIDSYSTYTEASLGETYASNQSWLRRSFSDISRTDLEQQTFSVRVFDMKNREQDETGNVKRVFIGSSPEFTVCKKFVPFTFSNASIAAHPPNQIKVQAVPSPRRAFINGAKNPPVWDSDDKAWFGVRAKVNGTAAPVLLGPERVTYSAWNNERQQQRQIVSFAFDVKDSSIHTLENIEVIYSGGDADQFGQVSPEFTFGVAGTWRR